MPAKPKIRKSASKGRKGSDWTSALSAFLRHLEAQERAPNTIKNYRADLLAFTTWYQSRFGERPVPALVLAEELREWKGYLRESRGQQPASVNRRLATMGAFFKWASQAGLSPPVEIPRTIDQVTPPPRWLAEKEQRALIRTLGRFGTPRDAAMVYVLMDGGLRVDELVGLQRDRVEIRDRSGKMVLIGKGRKQRTVDLGPRVRAALRAYLDSRTDAHPAVFAGQRGQLRARGVQIALDRLARLAGIGDLSPHCLRHTFGHNLAVLGTPIQVIADLMGHSSLDVTRRYIQPGQAERAAAVERLGGGGDA